MKKIVTILAAALTLGASFGLTSHAGAATLDDVKARGTLQCGVNTK